MNSRSLRVYVDVAVGFTSDGLMLPRSLVWEDGARYTIDRVKVVRPAFAARAGGQGDRYTIMVGGHETYLYFERSMDPGDKYLGRWFVERKG